MTLKDRVRSWITLKDRVRSSVIREELEVEPLFLHIERNQLKELRHLFLMPPWRGVLGMSYQNETLRKSQNILERLGLLAGLGTPWGPSR